jgi:hypothetical protein
MAFRNKKADGSKQRAKAKAVVVIQARPMDQQQKQRLSTAVDALLAEFVRQEIGRAKTS